MRLSIIIPTRNQRPFLGETLESIYSQSHRPDEVIVVDGASTDGTPDALRDAESRYPGLRWISEPDAGPADAVNKGLAMANGDIAAIQSSDDVYLPGAFTAVMAVFHEDQHCGMLVGDMQGVDPDGNALFVERLPAFSWEAYFGRALRIPQSSIFFRMSVAREAGAWNPAYFTCDLDFWLRLMLRTRVRHLGQVLSGWRLHPDQRTTERNNTAIWDGYWRMIAESPELKRAPARVRRLAQASRHLLAARHHPSRHPWMVRWHLLLAFLRFPTFWRHYPWPLAGWIPGVRLGRRTIRFGRRMFRASGLRRRLHGFRRHWQRGTLLAVVQSRLGIQPERVRVKWEGARTQAQGMRFLAQHARAVCFEAGPGVCTLSVGNGTDFHQRLDAALRHAGVAVRSVGQSDLAKFGREEVEGLALVVSGFEDVRGTTELARRLVRHPWLSEIPFEYAAGIDPAQRTFSTHDEYAGTFFVSPVLLDDPSPYALYEESLQHFEQKCGLRDYLDLYQFLRHAVQTGVTGDVAEFGSFRGHSGWLIARTMQALGDPRRLYMFDTFNSFPKENAGIDRFWSRTHPVDFEEVRRKLADFPNVQLVRGDFTRTLAACGIGDIALAWVDCDSWRATAYLLESLPRKLSLRGVMALEDYGHPALLGNRVALHEAEAALGDGFFRFFSQFSGSYVLVRTG